MKVNYIGLDSEKTGVVINKLNHLLADYQQFYMNIRGFHWNVKGNSFFELHVKFEEIYTDINLKVDEIAERILALDGTPLHSFTDYQKISKVKETKNLTEGKEMVGVLLADFKTLIEAQRDILAEAGENSDEGTVSLMSDYITEHEKTMWMLKAYLA
ncbi:Dps family protein [Crocinitomix catalasitica]|uniref:Dps family protein n=1 Tax=Crocinitomix catalasitica TaxID=184607 RepID=UPI0004834154|nr:DNA starvation/stationary phase protection protein [Crocinitomix catalasitica]